MEAKKNILTFAGLKALEDELFDLKVVKRKEVAQKIKEAREQGEMRSMMQRKMSSATLKQELRRSRKFSKMWRLSMKMK